MEKYIVGVVGLQWAHEQLLQSRYVQIINSLGLTYSNSIDNINLLVANSTACYEYKIAKVRNIKCVTISWLLDSKKRKRILSVDKYQIKDILYRVSVVAVGFEDIELQKIQTIINHHAGTISLYNPLENQQYNCLLVSDTAAERLILSQTIRKPIVGLEWLEATLRSNVCKQPIDYALNYQSIKTHKKSVINQVERLEIKLNEVKQEQLVSESEDYLSETIIYIDDSVDYNLKQVLKKNICIRGGLYIKQIRSLVTHILVDSLTHHQYLDYLKHGDVVEIVRVQWLIDCIHLHTRMTEDDYRVRHFKNITQPTNHSHLNLNSKSTATFSNLIKFNNSITNSKDSRPVKKITIEKVMKSTIFKNMNFYIQSTQKKQKEMFGLGTKIRENGGSIWDGVSSKSMKSFYLVMVDSHCNPSILEKYKKYQDIIIPVSYRWVNYCIAKRQLVAYNKQRYYIFRPFSIKTPCPSFLTFIIEVLCVDDLLKLRMKQILSTLGTPSKFTTNQITHCICDNQYKSIHRYSEIVKSGNDKIKFVRIQWLLDCLNEGKVMETQQYLM